jgi:hypothetical protein
MSSSKDKKKWGNLSPLTRKLILGAGLTEGALKLTALVDIARRPSSEIRGPKKLWVPLIITVNSFGAAPLAYLYFGRRRSGPGS